VDELFAHAVIEAARMCAGRSSSAGSMAEFAIVVGWTPPTPTHVLESETGNPLRDLRQPFSDLP
jgi:hypothetical protein